VGCLGASGAEDELPGLSTKLFVPVAGAIVPVGLTIPNSPSLVGFSVYTQAAAMATGLNPLGLIASNGLRIDVGT
jgi:hypothetical protein